MRGLRAPFRIFTRPRPGAEEAALAKAVGIIKRADGPRPDDWLALTGDKSILFDDAGEAFLAYARQGRAFAVAGAPTGKETARRLLAAQTDDLARRQRRRLVFYGVCQEDSGLVAPLGMKLFKIGETALIDLPEFSLKGKRGDNLRATRNRLSRDGASFEVIPAAQVSASLPALREVSDDWLGLHKSREKAFSLGFFSDRYLVQNDIAIIRLDGEIAAFANLWPTSDRSALSFDLMRYRAHAPKAVIDFLILELAFWAQEQEYQLLDIGLAPLSGLEDEPHARMLARMGDFVFDTAERFYGFRGLRRFKEKFHPRWSPRFIAARSQIAAARGLIDCALLTSRGWRPADAPRKARRRKSQGQPLRS